MSHFSTVFIPSLLVGMPCAVFTALTGHGIALAFMAAMFVLLGNSCGYHRIFAHRPFKPHAIVDFMLLLIGSLAGQGSSVNYVILHRLHHAHADTDRDTHTPARGFWNSVGGWQLRPIVIGTADIRSAKHLLASPTHRFIHEHYRKVLAAVIATLLFINPIWCAVYLGAVGITTIVVNLENFVTHRFGYRNHSTPDRSTNFWLTGYLLGWHNNHHQNPQRFSTREKWWEIDLQDMLHPLLRLGSPGAWK